MAKDKKINFILRFDKRSMDAIRRRFDELMQDAIDKASNNLLYGTRTTAPPGMPLGKSPIQAAREERKDLEAQLQQALEREDYETAAKIRDQLNDRGNQIPTS